MRRFAAVLFAVVVAANVHAAVRTWVGAASNLWSNPANWDSGVPVAGDAVRFDAPHPFMSPVNDLPAGLSLTSVVVTTGYTVSGNGIVLTSGLDAQGGTTTSLPITLGANAHFTGTAGAGTVNFAMPVNLNGYALSINAAFPGITVIVSNTISGAGSITAGNGVWFTGHNTFTGSVNANGLAVFTNDALGVADGTVANGTVASSLGLHDVNTGNESLTLTGQIICNGTCTIGGPVNGSGLLYLAGGGQFIVNGRITSDALETRSDGGGGTLLLTNPANAIGGAAISLNTRVGATGALDVTGILSIAGATLDLRNNRVTAGDFRMSSLPGTTLAAGAQPVVHLSTARAPFLDGALTLTPGFVPSAPSYLIIDNRSPYPIPTKFDNLPEGGSFTFNGNTYFITYQGGDGNDVVLYVNAPPVPPTTTTLTSSGNPSNEGDAVTFTATVTSGSGVPAGTVTFRDGAADLATVALNNGQATFTTSSLSGGAHTITALYNPTSSLAPSTSAALTQTVIATPPQVSVSNASVVEGNSGTTPAVFSISLSHASASPVVVDYATQDGSATAGSDYLATSGTLTFGPGETHKTVVVEVIGDTQPENDETFALRVSPAQSMGTATVRNDDVIAATTYEYANIAGRSLTLDLSLPVTGSGPFPVILWVHGADVTANPALREVSRGYAVARVNYRTADEAKFPAQIADLKAAVRWLRAHATERNLDALRIGAWGSDTGAWFASLLGTVPEAFDDPAEGNVGFSSRISAVLDWGGETDLPGLLTDPTGCLAAGSIESQFLGCAIASCPSTATTASPIHWVSSADAAFLIAHGTTDCTVPPAQSTRFAAALQTAGADVVLKIVPDTYWTADALIDADAFFDAKLKGLEIPAKRRSSRH